MNFTHFRDAVATQFARLIAQPQVFRVDIKNENAANPDERHDLFRIYLDAFPPGSNPIFKTRGEFECNCCKQFIRAVGNVVAIVDGKLETVWDNPTPQMEEPFKVVAAALSDWVKSRSVADYFYHYEGKAGTPQTRYEDDLTKRVGTWTHFAVTIPNKFVISKDARQSIDTVMSLKRSNREVFARALEELTPDAVETVLDLITQNLLYRGDEHARKLKAFKELQDKYMKLPTERSKEYFTWVKADEVGESVAKIRNSAVGTLLIDLSNELELEQAVAKYDHVMAPQNYQRNTALVSKRQIQEAKAKLEELGLTSALDRRFARMTDINVADILFVDNTERKNLAGNPLDDLEPTKRSKERGLDGVEEVQIDDFIARVLPTVSSMEVYLTGEHAPRFMSLTAPCDPTAGRLFKWDNGIAWDYRGGFADSIKERVKQAGGSIEGDLCCRLAWECDDDFDFHMFEPNGRIYFGDRRGSNGGQLDVDANGQDGVRPHPVENIFYKNKRTMRAGTYQLRVHNFRKRALTNEGFTVEIEFGGRTYSIVYDKCLKHDEVITVAEINVDNNGIISLGKSLPFGEQSKTVFGLQTLQWHKVNLMTLSPNFWGEKTGGNKHWFFILNGAQNDGEVRGFYNEYLHPDLHAHRKVFEIVGSKMKVEADSEQLSGIGFSSTQSGNLLCRVKGSINRTLKLVF